MAKRFAPILVLAVLAVAAIAAIVLRPDHTQTETPKSPGRDSSVATAPAPEQPGSLQKRAAGDRAAAKKDEASDEVRPPARADTARKPAPGGSKRSAGKPAAGGEQRDRPGRAQTVQLFGMAMRIMALERGGEHPLTADQAKRVLAVLKPLRARDKLSDQDAGRALESLKRILTADQVKAMADMGNRFSSVRRSDPGGPPAGMPRPDRPRPEQNGMRPGVPPGPPRPENGRRPAGPRRLDFNPFASKAPGGDQRAEAMVKMMDQFFAGLEKKAASP